MAPPCITYVDYTQAIAERTENLCQCKHVSQLKLTSCRNEKVLSRFNIYIYIYIMELYTMYYKVDRKLCIPDSNVSIYSYK